MKILKPDEKGTSLYRKITLAAYTIVISLLSSIAWWIFSHGAGYVTNGYKEWSEQHQFRLEVLKYEREHSKVDSVNEVLKEKIDELQDESLSELNRKQDSQREDMGTIIKTSVSQTQTIGLLSERLNGCCNGRSNQP